MKLLFVTESFPGPELVFSGGVESFTYSLIRSLAKKNQITVLCQYRNGLRRKEVLANGKIVIKRVGPRINRIDTSFLTMPKRFLFLLSVIKTGLKENFDLVQGDNFVVYPVAYLIGLLKKKPTFAWYADVFLGKWFSFTNPLSAIVGELSERLSIVLPWTKVIALSRSTRKKLTEQGLDGTKISISLAGVDDAFFTPARKQNKVIKIVTISRLVNYKRIDLLIEAVKILKDKGCQFNVNIIGEGSLRADLENQIESLDLDNIKIESSLTRLELKKRLQGSDIFCLPSEVEGFGLVILEAASCGLPFVAANIPTIKEVTKNGKGGLLFKSGNAADLAEKLELFLKNNQLRSSLSKQAIKLTSEYSWKIISQRFEGFYQDALKPKVLMLIDGWFPHVGGGQVHAWELSRKLSDLGCKVTILTRNLGKWGENYSGVEVKRIGFIHRFDNILGRVEYLCWALFYSLFARYDLFHAHAFSPGLIVPILKFFRNKPVIFTAHGEGWKISGLGIKSNFLQDLVFYNIRYDVEITVAKSTFKEKTSSKKTIVIPNGVNIEDFQLAQRKRTSIKRLIYVGRLFKDKGVHLLIEAFKNLKRKNLNLTVVGDGPEMDNLKKQAKGYKIKFKGQLLGPVLSEEMKKADLLIMPSLVEGMPIRLLESWAAKLPILATKVGDNEYYIKHGINGYLCDPNPDSIKTVLDEILEIKNLETVAENGFKDVQKFTWDNIAQKTYRIYQEVMDEKTKN